jgi:hypothetical protein
VNKLCNCLHGKRGTRKKFELKKIYELGYSGGGGFKYVVAVPIGFRVPYTTTGNHMLPAMRFKCLMTGGSHVHKV